jgi:hypothetical protein
MSKTNTVTMTMERYESIQDKVKYLEDEAAMYKALMQRELSNNSDQHLYVSFALGKSANIPSGIYTTNELLHELDQKIEIVQKSNIFELIFYKLFTKKLD